MDKFMATRPTVLLKKNDEISYLNDIGWRPFIAVIYSFMFQELTLHDLARQD